MLSSIQREAIVRCLTGIDLHAQHQYRWPGPTMLAVLRETPVAGHPDATARHLGVVPAPVPPATWRHPDGTVAALRQVAADLHHPVIQATVSAATDTDVRLLAWTFLHTPVLDVADLGTIQVRQVEAVDIDDTVHVLTHLPDRPDGLISIHDVEQAGAPESILLLRALAHTIRTT